MSESTTSTSQTRAGAILAAVSKHLNDRRAFIDRSDDLGSLCITVRLQAGTAQVRSVNVTEEHVMWRNG